MFSDPNPNRANSDSAGQPERPKETTPPPESLEHVLPDTFEQAAGDLMVTVHSRIWLEMRQLKNIVEKTDQYGTMGKPFAEHLACSVVHSREHTKRYLGPSVLQKWGVPLDTAWEAALGNLLRLDFKFMKFPEATGFFESAAGDTYDAARMLVPSAIVRDLAVEGSHVVMVPNPNTLLITGDRDLAGLKMMLERSDVAMREQPVIGQFAFRFTGDSQEPWQPWVPDRSHPLHEQFRSRANRTLKTYYDYQRKIIAKDELEQVTETGFFLASFETGDNDAFGPIRSISTWSPHTPTLLPKADAIMFVRNAAELKALVPWSVVARTMANNLEPVGLYPERYLVRSFPTEGKLRAMIRQARKRGVPQSFPSEKQLLSMVKESLKSSMKRD